MQDDFCTFFGCADHAKGHPPDVWPTAQPAPCAKAKHTFKVQLVHSQRTPGDFIKPQVLRENLHWRSMDVGEDCVKFRNDVRSSTNAIT